MANACFRCKERIDSGKTFCGACREEVSLEFSYNRESRMWVVVAVGSVLQLVLVLSEIPVITFPLSLVLAYALLKDAGNLRRRDDSDWSPSKWGYRVLAGLLFFVVTGPLIAGYHLSRRHSAVGLRLRRYAE